MPIPRKYDQASALLSEEQIEIIVDRAAQKAVEQMTANFYREVGKSLVNRFLVWLGVAAVSFLIGAGKIKVPW